MKRFFNFTILIAVCLAVFGLRVRAQSGTAHGIATSWAAPNPVGGSGTIQGYYLFRCVGTCTTGSMWTAVDGLIAPTASANCTVPLGSSACYLDPAAGLNANTTYSYAVETVDSNGNVAAYSNISTVAVTTFPINPNPPTGCFSKVQ
jgi:hypothetical protein